MIFISKHRRKLSAYTNQDSEGNPMVKDHAFRAQTDGKVTAFVTSSGSNVYLRGYVGLTSDPAGAGDKIQDNSCITTTFSVDNSFDVAKGEYFELVTNSTNAVTIRWKSWGRLKKPIDFN